MKQVFKNGLLLLAAVSAALYWHCQQAPAQSATAEQARAAAASALPPTQYDIGIATVQNNNGFNISFDPNVINPLLADTADDDNWRVFVNFGDGTFWMGLKSAFDWRTFTYETMPSKPLYAELTPTYDDDDKNPGRSALVTYNGPASSSDHQRDVIMGTKYVKLQSNRSPLRGDSITYIITYQHQRECNQSTKGDLVFHYDPDVLELEIPGTNLSSIDRYNSETEYLLGSALGKIHLKFAGLQQGEQRNIFLRMVTKTDFASTHAYVPPWVTYSDTLEEKRPDIQCGDDVVQDTSNMQYQAVLTSHDPNYKFGAENSLAPSPNTDWVTFTVMFQNEGPDSTRQVKVYDELDPLLVRDTPILVSWSTPKRPKLTIDNRTVKFDFGSLQVRGLGEEDYGIKFGEDSTKEVFTFRCAVRKQTRLNTDLADPNVVEYRPCDAICNQAWVIFDCNPRYPTNVAKVPIRCSPSGPSPSPSPSPAPTAFIAPSLCQEFRDTLNFDTLSTDSFLLLPTQLAQLSATLQVSTGQKYKWYPSENLLNPFALNPVVRNPSANKPPPHQYVLVASSSSPQCMRRIAHVNLPSPCSLSIVITPIFSGAGGCASGQITSLEASVTGLDPNDDPSQLQWETCAVVGPTHTKPLNQNQDEYYFGVTDPATGCSAEVLYKLSSTSGGGGGSGPWGSLLVAGLLIAIGAMLYAVFKKK